MESQIFDPVIAEILTAHIAVANSTGHSAAEVDALARRDQLVANLSPRQRAMLAVCGAAMMRMAA